MFRRLDPSIKCSQDCSCDPTAFTPVCGSDGRNYFSPCYAGCQIDAVNNTETVGLRFIFEITYNPPITSKNRLMG